MKRTTKYSLLLAAMTIVFAYCTPKKTTSSEAAKTYTQADLDNGMMIWQTNCKKCHELYPPENYNQQRWNGILDHMIPKAKLNKDDGDLVRAYIMQHAPKS